MKFWEALRFAQEEGKKITCQTWHEDDYIYWNEKLLRFVREDGRVVELWSNVIASEWEIYTPPIKKTVYQWRWKRDKSWVIDFILRTEEDAAEYFSKHDYEKHSGPFEVE